MSARALTPAQTYALFDILTHHETYREIEAFKHPEACAEYGFPFAADPEDPDGAYREESALPVLQMLLTKFVLIFPGAVDLQRGFWSRHVQGILARLGEAGLSDSYDKGAMGTRKTLATASAAMIAVVVRGVLAGFPEASRDGEESGTPREYDLKNAADLVRAWDDVTQDLVYGTLVDGVSDHMTVNVDLEQHSAAVATTVDYCIIHIASFLHQVFVISPDGQYLLTLIETVNKLIPYTMVKHTLRVSNAATLMAALIKLLLAKLSVTSITNWTGLTSNPDDGQNLLQRIISLTCSWDSSEFKKTAEKIEKTKDRPSDGHLSAIKQHVQEHRNKQLAVRAASIENAESIVKTILNTADPGLAASLSKSQHEQCQEYLSALLSVRDREEIPNALCKRTPDLFTQTVRDLFLAFEPMIRSLHDKIDLRQHIDAARAFMDDFIKISKGKKVGSPEGKGKEMRPPSVDDYVDLLRRHRFALYRWLHDIGSKCPEIKDMCVDWAKEIAQEFSSKTPAREAENMDERLNALFESLPGHKQDPIVAALDAHMEYLTILEQDSFQRMQSIADPDSEDSARGTGIYLSRWQDLMDETQITPGEPHGEMRLGRHVRDATTKAKPAGGKGQSWDFDVEEMLAAPDVSIVTGTLGAEYTALLAGMGLARIP